MMYGIVFAKQDAFSLLGKHTVGSNVSIILENTYSTFHVDNCMHSVAALFRSFFVNGISFSLTHDSSLHFAAQISAAGVLLEVNKLQLCQNRPKPRLRPYRSGARH